MDDVAVPIEATQNKTLSTRPITLKSTARHGLGAPVSSLIPGRISPYFFFAAAFTPTFGAAFTGRITGRRSGTRPAPGSGGSLAGRSRYMGRDAWRDSGGADAGD